MPRVEFGHLYKFLVSLGLALIFAGIALPWFVIQASEGSAVPQDVFDSLVQSSQRLVSTRHSQLEWILTWYPIASVTLVGLGAWATIFGLLRWRGRQAVFDENENIMRDIAKYNYSKMTAEEIAESRIDEATAGLEESSEAPPANNPSDEGVVHTQPADQDNEDHRSSEYNANQLIKLALQSHAQLIEEAETQVFELLRFGFGNTHRFESHVKIGGSMGSTSVDALLVPKDTSMRAIAIDVVVFGGTATQSSRLRDQMTRFASAAQPYGPSAGSLSLCQILVVEKPMSSPITAQLVMRRRAINEVLKTPVYAVVVDRERLSSVPPTQFRDAIVSAVNDPHRYSFFI